MASSHTATLEEQDEDSMQDSIQNVALFWGRQRRSGSVPSVPPGLGFVCDRRQHLHMPKARFPKLTCLMPSFVEKTTPRWNQVFRSYCTKKCPRKTCHHILLTIHRGCLQDFLRDKKRTYPQVRLADILRCWWLKPSGQAAHGQSTHPGARGQHCPAQAAAGAGPDKERGKPWEVEFCLW